MAPDTGELAVIALGKLGGYELNYASDVDLLFLHRDPGRGSGSCRALGGRRDCAMLAEPTAEGIALRVDDRSAAGRPSRCPEPFTRGHPRLRPGVRHVGTPSDDQGAAGRRRCGPRTRVRRGVTPFVYPPELARPPSRTSGGRRCGSRSTSANGAGVHRGQAGEGGIRDVEFAVQLLQIVHGRRDVRLRTPNTLAALRSLALEGYVADADAEILADAYRFLQRVEHRLQIVRDLQTHDLPAGRHARTTLALARTPGRRRPHRRVRSDDRTGPIDPRAAVRPLLESFAGPARCIRVTAPTDRPPRSCWAGSASPNPPVPTTCWAVSSIRRGASGRCSATCSR